MKRCADPWMWALAASAVATRAPFIPSGLYDFDAAAFAEALKSFEPLRFHPHPPGYTLYVLVTKLLFAFVGREALALALASLAASTLTVCATYALGRELAGRRAGLFAAVLYLSSPLAWTYGAVQGTYGFGALGAVVVARLAWRRLEGDAIRPAWLGLASAVAAGFRPDSAVVLAPLVLAACALAPGRAGVRRRVCAVAEAAVVGAVGLVLWVAPAASASGSLDGYRAAVARQWQAVAFSNAQDHFSWVLFRWVNLIKLVVYGCFALGPAASIVFPFAARKVARATRITPAAKLTLFGWLLGYVALSVGVAFGQPGMLLTALPAACLIVAMACADAGTSAPAARWLAALAVGGSAIVFLAAPLLGARAFFDSSASVRSKLATELLLFTHPGIALVDHELGGALDRLRDGYAPGETVILTNVASSTRAMWALPEHRVACYFAFAGFAAPIPAHDVGEPRGTWSLPPGARWLALLDADRHSISIDDQLGDRISVAPALREAQPRTRRSVLRVFDLAGASAIRFRDGRIEPLGGSGIREVERR